VEIRGNIIEVPIEKAYEDTVYTTASERLAVLDKLPKLLVSPDDNLEGAGSPELGA
jgi:hypothetical protein